MVHVHIRREQFLNALGPDRFLQHHPDMLIHCACIRCIMSGELEKDGPHCLIIMDQIEFILCKIFPAVAEIECFGHSQNIGHEPLFHLFRILDEFCGFIQALQFFARISLEIFFVIEPVHNSVQDLKLIPDNAYRRLNTVLIEFIFVRIRV